MRDNNWHSFNLSDGSPHQRQAADVERRSRIVTLNPEITRLVEDYAKQTHTKPDVAANELLRQALGAA